MKNLTVTLDAKTIAWARVHAAREGLSLSRFVSKVLQEKMRQSREYEAAMRRFFAVQPRNLSNSEPYPDRDELYERKSLR